MSAGKVQRPLHFAAWVVALAALAAGLWAGGRIRLNRPPRQAIRRAIAQHLEELHFAPATVSWKVSATDAGAARIEYVAQVRAAEAFYVPADTFPGSRAYIEGRLGGDLAAWMAAQRKPLSAADQAAIGAPPADPLTLNIVRISTRLGTPFEIQGSLEASRLGDAWTFQVDPGAEFAPAAPTGRVRADLPPGSLLEGDPADEATLAKVLSDVRAYAEKVAAAPPADLPVEARMAVKLAQAGVGEDAIASQLQTDAAPMPLSAEGIIFLAKAGVPQNVIRALIDGSGRQLHRAGPGRDR
ncbi:MAG TPA: hypothetical protein VHV47_10610 [Opitutaceae bacterium]|jgi:hypothetical protein|nr:hypothetical protein [Opitutaceae bacterium]